MVIRTCPIFAIEIKQMFIQMLIQCLQRYGILGDFQKELLTIRNCRGMAVKVNCYFVVSYDNFLNFDLYSNWSDSLND